MRVVKESAEKLGLKINTAKSSCMIYNLENGPQAIENISVVENMKYLGVHFNSGRDYFNKQKKERYGELYWVHLDTLLLVQ